MHNQQIKRIPFTGSTGEITRCTISKSKTGRWFASVSYRYMPVKNKELYIIRPDDVVVNTEPLKAIGIDLGITTYITGTDTLGNTLEIPNPTFAQQYEKRLAKLNRQLALKEDTKFKVDENGEYILSQYGNKVYSNNYRKQKLKITKLFEKVTNKKIDFQNRLSKQLIKNYDYIFLEDLEISSMIRETEEYLRTTRLKQTRRYNLADAAFYRFTQMLEYKGKWYNTTIQKVDKYFPSTRLCSYCQTKYPENLLSNIKEWVCLNPNCPTHQSLPGIPFKIPRDINASINLLR